MVTVRLQVIRAFGPWSKGEIITAAPPNWARQMIERGFVREYDEPKEMRSPFDRMMRRGRTKNGQ